MDLAIIEWRNRQRMLAGVAAGPCEKSREGIAPARTDEAVADLANISSNTIRKIERIEEVAAPEVKTIESRDFI